MRILLVGEYSGVHTNLKVGLEKIGAEVLLVSEGDVWKKFDSDIRLYYPEDKRWKQIYNRRMIRKCCEWAKKADIVQFINPSCLYFVNSDLAKYVFRLMDNAAVSVTVLAGCDCNMAKYFENLLPCICPACEKEYARWHSQCPYKGDRQYQEYERRFYERVDHIVPGEWDYYKIYYDHVQRYNHKMSRIIPFPVDCNSIRPVCKKGKKVVIHSPLNRACKGITVVQKAFKKLEKKYDTKAEFQIRGHMPIKEYLRYLNDIDVIVDGVKGYSYGLGMGSLMAMAKGKITVGVRELIDINDQNEWLANSPQIDVGEGENGVIEAIGSVICSPQKICGLQKANRRYVRKYHNSTCVANQYSSLYQQLLQKEIVG